MQALLLFVTIIIIAAISLVLFSPSFSFPFPPLDIECIMTRPLSTASVAQLKKAPPPPNNCTAWSQATKQAVVSNRFTEPAIQHGTAKLGMEKHNRACQHTGQLARCLAAQTPSPAQPSTAQHSTAQHSTAQPSTAQPSITQLSCPKFNCYNGKQETPEKKQWQTG